MNNRRACAFVDIFDIRSIFDIHPFLGLCQWTNIPLKAFGTVSPRVDNL